MTESSDNHNQTSYSPSVGERLRHAREAKKITIAEVVKQLKLTKENIVYLESDQWDKLHGRPYAYGYFSSYVNFLGLPHAEMLALFDLEYESEEPSADNLKRIEQKNDNNSSFGWLKLLVLIAILTALGWYGYQYWLEEVQSQHQQAEIADTPTQSTPDVVEQVKESPESTVLQNQYEAESKQSSVTDAEQEQQIPVIKVEPELQKPAIESQVEEKQENVTTLETSTETVDSEDVNPPVEENLENIQQLDNSLEDEKEALGNANTNTQELSATPQLEMQFSDDCWVEVRDNNNKSLLHKMFSAGERAELPADEPLQVLLGNASAVTVRFNNEAFDTTSYTRKNVAHFSVGEPSE